MKRRCQQGKFGNSNYNLHINNCSFTNCSVVVTSGNIQRLMCANTFQGACRYPHNNLQCPFLKEALTREFVTPVIQHGDQPFAFRVVWRQTDDEPLEAAWDAIAIQRQRCDAVLRAQPNVEFFVSAVTGVFTKSATKGIKPRAVLPAVSYWVVMVPCANSHDDNALPWRLTSQLHGVCADAECKAITVQTRRSSSSEGAANISAPLYVALKDHRSRFIKRRVDRSLRMLGDDNEARAPSRVVVLPHSKYREHIMNAKQVLRCVNLCADFFVADDNQVDNL